jgi:MFS family permease
MTNTDNIHRYLDEAFADIPRTPETADLKEEIRGNLQARVTELEANGTKPESAAAKAIRELGDIHDLVDSIGENEPAGSPGDTAARLMALNRVKVRAAYVVRTVLLALLLAGGVTIVTVGSILGGLGIAPAWLVYALPVESVLSGAFLGLIVGDALDHETSQHYPMPPRRAFGFGLASFAGLTGLGFVAIWFANPLLWLLLTGCVLALASLIAFIALGVTQTNRMKPWVKQLNSTYLIEDRFSQDPASAARFGLYTVVIWVLAFAGFVVLSIVVGFVWSWLALLAGLAIFFLVLARMLFPADTKAGTRKPTDSNKQ